MEEKVYSIDEIKKNLSVILVDEPVYKVILFGSYAKNNANSKSDLDLVIDTKKSLMGLNFLV